MQIKVHLFGPQAALARQSLVTLDIDAKDVVVSDIVAALGNAVPALAPTLAGSRLAINHAYALSNDAVTVHDELALIGMVSGG